MEKAKNIVSFYVTCNKLKDIVRTGWQEWGVQRERVESIAEHIYGVQMLVIAMWSEFKYDIDLNKVLSMIAVHEMEEILIGDITLFDKKHCNKTEDGHKAVEEILSVLQNGKSIRDLIFEFDERKTNEAKFAYWCDKLECDLQCKLYDEQHCVDLNKQQGNEVSSNQYVKQVLDEEKTWSKAWIRFGQERYDYDKNFLEVSNFAKDNEISKIIICKK